MDPASAHDKDTISVSKLAPPRLRADFLPRPRLRKRMAACARHKLLLVAAPAGYGKSSMIADHVKNARSTTYWYRLDSSDSNHVTFILGLMSCIGHRHDESSSRNQPDMRVQDSHTIGMAVDLLIKSLHDSVALECVIVLDDYHTIDDDSHVHELMDMLLDNLPPSCRVIIGSRSIPKLGSIARLTVADDVAVIGSRELRFTEPESQRLLRLIAGSAIGNDDVRAILDASEGWVAAIILYAVGLSGGLPAAPLRSDRDPEILFDYLAREVFGQQAAEVQQFLLATSLLDELHPGLCDAVLDGRDSAERIRFLVRKSLFIECVDEKSAWFRYHTLFRRFLEHRLARSVDESRIIAWHRRAAAWFAADQDVDTAAEARHLLAAGDVDAAAERMNERLSQLYADGRYLQIIRLVSTLPGPVLDRYPRLIFRLGGAYLAAGETDQALASFDRAIGRFADLGDDEGVADTLVSRSEPRHLNGDIDGAIDDLRRALALAASPLVQLRARRQLAQCMLLRNDRVQAEILLHEALEGARACRRPNEAGFIHAELSMLYQLGGDSEQGIEHALAAVGIWRDLGQPGGLALALNNLGTAYHAQGRLEQAEHYLREAYRQAHLAGIWRYEAVSLLSLADVAADRDDFRAAVLLYERGVHLARVCKGTLLLVYGLAMWADVVRLQRDPERASRMLAEARSILAHKPHVYSVSLVDFVRGVITLDRGDYTQAARLLEASFKGFGDGSTEREVARSALYRAVAAACSGKPDEVAHWRQQAATLMQKSRFPESFRVDVDRAERYHAAIDLKHRMRDSPSGPPEPPAGPAHPPAPGKPRPRPPSESPAVSVLALGPPCVMLGAAILDLRTFETQSARDLLFFLIDLPHGCTREELMLAFWPDSTAARARSALNSTLTRLRRAMGRDVIATEGDRCHIVRSIALRYDADLFRHHLAAAADESSPEAAHANLDCAIALVRGDYLQGINAQWCVDRRWEYDRLVADTRHKLAQSHVRSHRWHAAAAEYARLVAKDPLDESAYRGLMQSYAAVGERSRALQVYARLVDWLDQEVGVEPDPRTAALYQAIRGSITEKGRITD